MPDPAARPGRGPAPYLSLDLRDLRQSPTHRGDVPRLPPPPQHRSSGPAGSAQAHNAFSREGERVSREAVGGKLSAARAARAACLQANCAEPSRREALQRALCRLVQRCEGKGGSVCEGGGERGESGSRRLLSHSIATCKI